MTDSLSDVQRRAREFPEAAGITLTQPLGHGIDGNVWRTSRQSALKVFARQDTYCRERDCYWRLFENGVGVLAGFDVPELLDYSNSLWTIEMTIVSPPCVLDFGKAYVDSPPDYSPEALAEAEAAERELFTEDEWKQVRLVRADCGGTASTTLTRGRATSCFRGVGNIHWSDGWPLSLRIAAG